MFTATTSLLLLALLAATVLAGMGRARSLKPRRVRIKDTPRR